MAIYVPGEREISAGYLLTNKYTPLNKILSSFTCKASKAMTRIDFRTYLVVKLSLWSIMSSYPGIKQGSR